MNCSGAGVKQLSVLCIDPSLPRPNISISPSGLVVLGGRVNLRCEIEDGPATFYLHRAGDPTLEWLMKPDFDVGEHPISNVSWTHQGNYSCSYSFDDGCFVRSAHSDPWELLVSGVIIVFPTSLLALNSSFPPSTLCWSSPLPAVCSSSESCSALLDKYFHVHLLLCLGNSWLIILFQRLQIMLGSTRPAWP